MQPMITTNYYPPTLPKALHREYDEARSVERKLEKQLELHPPAGRPRLYKTQGPVVSIVGDTQEEVESIMKILGHVVGPKYKGNKRRGHIALYADLVQTYINFRKLGIAFPCRSNLSASATLNGLGDVLRRHWYVEHDMTDIRLAKNTRLRADLAASLHSQIRRVREVMADTPSP